MNDTRQWPDIGFDGANGLRDSLSAARAKAADLETALSLQKSMTADAAAQVDALAKERDALRDACRLALVWVEGSPAWQDSEQWAISRAGILRAALAAGGAR